MSNNQKTWKNTFAPHVTNTEFTIGMIIGGLKHHTWKYENLPKEIQEAVTKYMDTDDKSASGIEIL